ncbi:hypothetical protein PAAG_08983 [Paracoccidioides lutzii Pb01]|uniref:Cyclin-dependent protein kinase complex component n=1 Tax=Paracoccidioides lutzii (strain ATCC MYA-826 / Pb01) TaxID=502779 RepID=C1HDZ0_PARBA|nr:hypothetical protein PAAG_08983 [Paracoccidioides lutzii Pb01]EEH40134.1 hypothetical protein PAAG_08983 [Paracoccidioides lutzii Pb01]
MSRRNQEQKGDMTGSLSTPLRQLSIAPSQLPQQCTSVDDVKLSRDAEVFNLSAESALKILCARVDKLAKSTGDIPSSTPVGEFIPQDETCTNSPTGKNSNNNNNLQTDANAETGREQREIDSPRILIKSFYSKQISSLTLEEYLLRLHRYCPMSTAVYLATSHYIIYMATVEKIIYVTPRNMHRLILGGLRVASKMMEDLCYRHRRFAKVGGVTERELARLEINFCFLMDYDLKVDVEMMFREIEAYREGAR